MLDDDVREELLDFVDDDDLIVDVAFSVEEDFLVELDFAVEVDFLVELDFGVDVTLLVVDEDFLVLDVLIIVLSVLEVDFAVVWAGTSIRFSRGDATAKSQKVASTGNSRMGSNIVTAFCSSDTRKIHAPTSWTTIIRHTC